MANTLYLRLKTCSWIWLKPTLIAGHQSYQQSVLRECCWLEYLTGSYNDASSFQWSIELLGELSSKYSKHRCLAQVSSFSELLQLWMGCAPTKTLVEIASQCLASMWVDFKCCKPCMHLLGTISLQGRYQARKLCGCSPQRFRQTLSSLWLGPGSYWVRSSYFPFAQPSLQIGIWAPNLQSVLLAKTSFTNINC